MIRLREIREERNLPQRKIAETLKRSITCISDWERGNREPSIEDIFALADFFEVSTDYLLGRESDSGIIQINSELSEFENGFISLLRKLPQKEQQRAYGIVQALTN